ncbi:hypothetical protein BDF19DRAFT_433394 [Syncephalis fuscata]|nr:hypothetical protein BDF19DRAFT_433394 [Syncephalis fuscata]
MLLYTFILIVHIHRDLGSIDFVWKARNETASLRQRYLAVNYQLLFGVIKYLWAVYVVTTYSRKLAPWCCLAINLSGVLLAVFISLPSIALGITSCHTLAWIIVVGVAISSIIVFY